MHPLMKNSTQNGILNYIRIFLSISIILSALNPMIIASASPVDSPVSLSSENNYFYNINISDVVGGSANITTDKTTAQENDPVNLTISDIEPGKQFKSINVTDSNNAPIAL
ncbi:MAG: hypothetical protein QCH31_08530, partial [Methanolobus sp.]|nr:hypothetical protein [Methanolobus sp.]